MYTGFTDKLFANKLSSSLCLLSELGFEHLSGHLSEYLSEHLSEQENETDKDFLQQKLWSQDKL